MRALVIYESMFGTTRAVAEAIATGLGPPDEVQVARAADVTADQVGGVDLLVVGAPTHIHGLPGPRSRKGTPNMAAKSNGVLELEPDADTAPGVRELLAGMGRFDGRAAAFDTRISGVSFFTGRASKRIARLLRKHGAYLVASPVSFIVAQNHLVTGELERATRWGRSLSTVGVP